MGAQPPPKQKPPVRPRSPLPRGGNGKQQSTIWKEREAKARMSSDSDSTVRGPPLRLRGGVNTPTYSLDSSTEIYAGTSQPSTIFTPGGQVVRKMTDRSPDIQLSDDSDESTTGLRPKKRKTSPEKAKLSAANSIAPGLRQEVALKHGK